MDLDAVCFDCIWLNYSISLKNKIQVRFEKYKRKNSAFEKVHEIDGINITENPLLKLKSLEITVEFELAIMHNEKKDFSSSEAKS